MRIRIARKGEKTRELSIAEAGTELDSGRLLPDDLACAEGSDSWRRLAEVLGREEHDAPPPTTMPPTSQRGEQSGGQSIYTLLSEALKAPLDQFLMYLETAIETGATASETFAVDFTAKAYSFTERCCSTYADLMRQHSRLPAVRGTPTVTLAKQVREDVFAKCDTIVAQCHQQLQKSAVLAASARAPDAGPGLMMTALQGAATGQLAAGLGKHAGTVGLFGAMLAVSDQQDRKAAVFRHQLEALWEAKDGARSMVPEYLKAISPGLCRDLFDYGCAKCLGPSVNFGEQESALEKLGEFLKDHQTKLDRVLKEAAVRRMERQQRILGSAPQMKASGTALSPAKRLGGWLLIVGGLFLIVLVGASLNSAPRGTGGFLAMGFIFGAAALTCGICLLRAGKNPPQAGAGVVAHSVPPVIANVAGSAEVKPVPQAKLCAYCGRENPMEAVYCRECGTGDFK